MRTSSKTFWFHSVPKGFAGIPRDASYAPRSQTWHAHVDYHLVICYIAMERFTIFKFGKPSISIRAINKPWRTVTVITRPGISQLPSCHMSSLALPRTPRRLCMIRCVVGKWSCHSSRWTCSEEKNMTPDDPKIYEMDIIYIYIS